MTCKEEVRVDLQWPCLDTLAVLILEDRLESIRDCGLAWAHFVNDQYYISYLKFDVIVNGCPFL